MLFVSKLGWKKSTISICALKEKYEETFCGATQKEKSNSEKFKNQTMKTPMRYA